MEKELHILQVKDWKKKRRKEKTCREAQSTRSTLLPQQRTIKTSKGYMEEQVDQRRWKN